MLEIRSMRQTTASIFAVGLVLAAMFSCRRADGQSFHKIQISNDADDGHYDGSGWHAGGTDTVGNSSTIGYRFPSTGVNSGDTIQSAYIEVVSSDSGASSATCGDAPCANTNSTFRVYGVAQDNGAAFSNTAGNTPLDVPYTSASTDYTTTGPGDVHGSCQGNNNGQNTCTHVIDVTNIVREITSRPGWTNTSAIRFVLTSTNPSGPNSGFEDSSSNSAKAAILVVNPPLPVVVSSGAWGTSASLVYPQTYQAGPFVYPGASTLLLFLGDYYSFNGVSVGPPSVSDSCGNSWGILAGPAEYESFFYFMRSTIYYVQNPVSCSAGDTISVATANQEPIFLHFLAVAGSKTSQAPIVSSFTDPGSPGLYTTSAPTSPVTMSASGLLVSWAFGDSDAPHTFTPQAGFTIDANSTPNYLTTVYQNVSSGTYSNTFSISPSDGWQAVLIGLLSSGTGVSASPAITSATNASAMQGQAFSYQIVGTNSPNRFGASGLPNGLSVNTSSGLISGTPTQSGTFSVILSASNSSGTGTATLSLMVTGQTTPTITWPTPAAITYGTQLTNAQLNATASVPGTFAYSPAVGTVLGVGSQTLSVTFTPNDTTSYTTATQTVQLVVTQATPVITWPTPSPITYPAALTVAQLNATASTPGTFAYNPSSGMVLNPGTQSLSVTFTPDDATNYTTAAKTVQLVVNPPGAPAVAWGTPTAITYGTPLSAAQLNATAQIPGTFAYSPGIGALLNAGTQTLSVTFTPTNTIYPAGVQTVQLVVNKASQAINFVLPSSASLATGSLALSAGGGASANPVTFSVVSGPGTISGGTLVFTGTGPIVVAANQAGNANYLAAVQVTQSVTVVSEPILVVAANDATRVYGAANPTFTGSITGALNGDAFTESFSTAAIATSNVGTYPIVPNVAGANLASYAVVVQNGTLTITKAGSSVSLTASTGSSASGQTVTLTATVAAGTSGTPTGTVTFFDGSAQLGTATLSSGIGSFSSSLLADGAAHSVTATYSGDGNFMASSMATPVIVGGPDFAVAVAGSSSATVTAGSAATYQLTVNPLSGSYPGTVTFTTSGLPVGATASFNPSSIAPNAGQQTVTATIQTSAATSMNVGTLGRRRLASISFALLLMPLLGVARLRRRGLSRLLILIMLLGGAGAASLLSGCGAGNFTLTHGSQSYNVTITASGGGMQHSVTISLNLQ